MQYVRSRQRGEPKPKRISALASVSLVVLAMAQEWCAVQADLAFLDSRIKFRRDSTPAPQLTTCIGSGKQSDRAKAEASRGVARRLSKKII